MKFDCTRSFDLRALLKIDNLDIEKAAQSNTLLQTGEYCKLLSEFMDIMLDAVLTLYRIASLEAGGFDFLYMKIIRKKLENIGCYKLMPIVSGIISADKRGQTDSVVACAKKLLDEFYNLYAGLVDAEKIPETETAPDTSNSDDSGGEYLASVFFIFPVKKTLENMKQKAA